MNPDEIMVEVHSQNADDKCGCYKATRTNNFEELIQKKPAK